MVARAAPILASVVLALLIIQPVDAKHCTTYSTSTTDLEYTVIVVDVVGIIYYPIIYCHEENDCEWWWAVGPMYVETNGIPGLQRGDYIKNDTCHGMIQPDWFPF